MKIVIINTTAEGGSIGSITSGLYKYLVGQKQEVKVCYGRGRRIDNKDFIKLDSDVEVKVHAGLTRLTGLQGYFSNFATVKLIKLLKSFQPDAVVLINLHGYYINERSLLNYLKKSDIRTVYIMADEYPVLGKCCFSRDCRQYITGCEKCAYKRDYPNSLFLDQAKRIYRRKQKIYDGFNNIVFAAPQINVLKVSESGLTKGKKAVVVDWGVDLNNLYYIRQTDRIKKKYNLPQNKKIILAVAPFSNPRKGIREFFLETAKKTLNNDLCFVNVGFDGDKSECPANYIPIGYIKDQEELAELYSCADVFVTTSRSDTMPLAALIALSCGTPVCCFNTSGLAYLGDDTCIYYVEDGNQQELQRVLEEIPVKTEEKQKICREYAEKRYSDQLFYGRIYELCKNVGEN